LFATAREAVGVGALSWPVPAGGIALRTLLDQLGGRYRKLKPILPGCRFFVNGELVTQPGRRRLVHGDELAVHPPYSGG
jgi:molybdopterin converting factor small subunit